MGMTKNYLLKIQENCCDQRFGQEAVEWAILSGWIKLTGDVQTDLVTIMGQPGKPETGKYDEIIVAYQRQCREHGDALVDLYHASGLFDEILRPMPMLPSIMARAAAHELAVKS
jgi:hypothetical protein